MLLLRRWWREAGGGYWKWSVAASSHKTLLRPAQNLFEHKSLSTCPQQRWSLCGGSSLSYSSAVGATVPPMPERVEFASRTEQRGRMNDAVSRVVPIKNQAYPPKIRFLLILPLWPPQGIGFTKAGTINWKKLIIKINWLIVDSWTMSNSIPWH